MTFVVPPLNPSKVFSDPLLGSQLRLILPPHPQVINNDRSLMSSLPCSGEKCSLISRTVASNEVLSISILRFSRNRINITIALCTSH